MGKRAEVGARGFTLLELVVTLFVIALAVALVGPAIGRSTETVRVRADVAGFAALFRHAREQAITQRRQLRVVVEPGAHRVTIVAGETDLLRTRVFPERLAIEPAASNAGAVRFEPEGTSTGGEYRLHSGDTTYRVTVDSVTGRVRSIKE
jgi:general secretion pathway protein H